MNMNVQNFIRTLYLGDRACKAIIIDGWSNTVRLQVDCISRVRSASGTWDYYTDEDVTDGILVFEDVDRVELRNAGHMPNDSINSIEVTEQEGDRVTVEISVDSVEPNATHHETWLRVRCKSVCIEDPAHRGTGMRT
jgi:hypothetical protein